MVLYILSSKLNCIATMSQVVELLKGHLSLEGPMWSGPKGSTRQLWFGYMALVIMDQGNCHNFTLLSPFVNL